MEQDESLKAITRTAKDVEAVAKKATLAAIEAAKQEVGRLEHDVANARKQMNNALGEKAQAERKRDDATQENEGNKAKFEKILQERNNLSSQAKDLGSQLKVSNDKIVQMTGDLKETRAAAKAAAKSLGNVEESAKKEIENLQSDIAVRDENIETYTAQMKEMTDQIIAFKAERDTLNATVTQLEARLAETNKASGHEPGSATESETETKSSDEPSNDHGGSGEVKLG